MLIALYLAAIVAANVLTAALQPLDIGPFIVPAGTFLIGATFIFRDLVQKRYGRATAYKIIGVALIMSGTTSYILGDPLTITLASAIAFVLSETTDTEIYTRLKLPLSWRVFYSGIVGGALDSAAFVVIGLSPIGAGFLPWEAVSIVIIGQIVVKSVMQALGAVVISATILGDGAIIKAKDDTKEGSKTL